MLLILSYREDAAGPGSTLRQTLDLVEVAGRRGIDLPVEPLPATEELAARLLDRAGRPGSDARLIAQRGEGHPLFTAELAVPEGAVSVAVSLDGVLGSPCSGYVATDLNHHRGGRTVQQAQQTHSPRHAPRRRSDQ